MEVVGKVERWMEAYDVPHRRSAVKVDADIVAPLVLVILAIGCARLDLYTIPDAVVLARIDQVLRHRPLPGPYRSICVRVVACILAQSRCNVEEAAVRD